MLTDPIADMLTRIRNANVVYRETVDVPLSRIKREIAEILKREGYIQDWQVVRDGSREVLRLTLKYGENRKRVIRGVERVSRPGRRVYCGAKEVPRVLAGLGTAVLSTSRGIMTDREARRLGVGGEVLFRIW